MTKINEAKKKLLDLEMEQEINQANERFAFNGMYNSGGRTREIVRIKLKYKLMKQELENNLDTQLDQPRPALFKKTVQSIYQYKLEKLFTRSHFATYIEIAKEIGLIKYEKQYNPNIKHQILDKKDIFNKQSKAKWGMKLKANRSLLHQGLSLVQVK